MKIAFRKYFLIVFIAIQYLPAKSQERKLKILSTEKQSKIAVNLLSKRSYYNAVEQLKELSEKEPSNKLFLERLANAYFISRDYKNAQKCYEALVRMDDKNITSSMYRYALCLKYNEDYERAAQYFQLFADSKYKEQKGEFLKKLAANEVESCKWAKRNMNNYAGLNINHLGDTINSAYTEFSPYMINDSTLMFASLQADSVITVLPEEPHSYHVKLYTSKLQNETWSLPQALDQFNKPYQNTANGTYSSDGSKFFFTRCIPDRNGKMICKIYQSVLKDSVYQKAKKLGKNINKKGYTSTMPNIAKVKTSKAEMEVLFFVSDRKGGRGGMDIYYYVIGKDGSLKTVSNAGKGVNTLGDEITPFYDYDAQELYFSSNFHYGFGGYDIFKIAGEFAKWENPKNLGKPVNSRVDDTYYIINKNTEDGYFVSNRPEGYHLLSETCCDDIYNFSVKNPFLLKVVAFENDSLRLTENNIQVFVKNSEQGETLTDKAKRLNDEKRLTLNLLKKDDEKRMQVVKENLVIDKSFFQELEKEDDIYSLERGKEYIIVISNKKDTSIIVFQTDHIDHKVKKIFREDSLTKWNLKNSKNLDLLETTVFIQGDSTSKVKMDSLLAVRNRLSDSKEMEVEDETKYTVKKLLDDFKKKERVGLKVIMNYDFDDEKFIRDHAANLDSLVQFMKDYPDVKIEIAAHTDDKGTEHYNLELSKKRAHSIEHYLLSKGINKARMVMKWYGEEMPLLPNTALDGTDLPENRRINRRAEITIIE